MQTPDLIRWLESNTGQNLVSLGDQIEVHPLYGRKKTIALNRTKMEFLSSQVLEGQSCRSILLEDLEGETFHLCLEAINSSKDKSPYKMSTKTGRPFWLNGSLVLEAIIKKNDVCRFGHNEICFKENLEMKEEQNSHLESLGLSMNIIKSDIPVLIQGETGTGKTTLAKKIHEQSERKGSFIHLNLSSFGTGTLESELFGHVKGAFTGAMNDYEGAFKQAEGGTLFLDEIDSISWELQTKLLLFLDNNTIRPVGGGRESQINCRLVFASGRDLSVMVQKHKMRKDFFYRLNSGHTLELVPLRSNPELIEKFCLHFATEHTLRFDSHLIDFYTKQAWPGNLRQHISHLKYKKILSKVNYIKFCTADEKLIVGPDIHDDQAKEFWTLKEMKNKYALEIYYRLSKNIELAASKLEISTKSLRRILKEAA